MPSKNFIKENFVLIVGLALPVLLMVGFMLASSMPQVVSDPPQYDLVFCITEYPSSSNGIPINVNLIVDKDGVLKAQYTKSIATAGGYVNNPWKKLYLYQHDSKKVKALTFGYPADMTKIEGTREDTIEATKGMKLDTTIESPDGYQLTTEYYGRSGLLGDVFWGGGGSSNEPVLKKGSSRVKLTDGDGRTTFNYSNPEFVGWVTGKN